MFALTLFTLIMQRLWFLFVTKAQLTIYIEKKKIKKKRKEKKPKTQPSFNFS